MSIVVSDGFVVGEAPPEAVRVSLGGVLSRAEVPTALEFLARNRGREPFGSELRLTAHLQGISASGGVQGGSPFHLFEGGVIECSAN